MGSHTPERDWSSGFVRQCGNRTGQRRKMQNAKVPSLGVLLGYNLNGEKKLTKVADRVNPP
jgi:hypothetical protein